MNAVVIRNRVPDAQGASPYERLTSKRPCLDDVKPFGCLVTVHIDKDLRKKLDQKSEQAILLGNLGYGQYRIFLIDSETITKSKHVQFDEGKFPAKKIDFSHLCDFEVEGDFDYEVKNDTSNEGEITEDLAVDTENTASNENSEETVTDLLEDVEDSPETSHVNSTSQQPQNSDGSARRYPLRNRQPTNTEWFRAGVCHEKYTEPDTSKPCHKTTKINDTPTLKEALQRDDRDLWVQAISEELEALHKAKTWELVDRPKNVKVLPSQFILRIKRNSRGEIDRYKARLVALGNLQRPHIDFEETYAPVVDFTVVRVVLVLVLTQNLVIRQLDVKSAFLNGTLQEVIHMTLPNGYQPKDEKVCRLKKSLYGLKQAPKAWNVKLTADLAKLNFRPINTAESVFIRKTEGATSYILIYVDDMLIISATEDSAARIVKEIQVLYEIKDLGSAEYFLGIKLDKIGPKKLKLTQKQYICDILSRFEMDNCKQVSTPLTNDTEWMQKFPLSQSDKEEMQHVPYREAIGSLMFLSTRTRPDLSTAVNILAKHSANPHPIHWKGVKRIFRYLQGTKEEGILLEGAKHISELRLHCSVDADWATDTQERTSRTGVVCYMNNNAVWWKSRKQHSIAVSSCEAEYMALYEGCKDVAWLRNLLCELGACPGLQPTIISQDNQSAMVWAENSGMRKVKHIDLRYNFSQQMIANGVVTLKYVSTDQNTADILTKVLATTKFRRAKQMLSVTA